MASNTTSKTSTLSATGCVTTSTRDNGEMDESFDLSDDHVTAFRRANPALLDEDTDSIDRQVFMSVTWQSGKLSVAYYDIHVMQIYMMLDTEESCEFNLLRRIIEQLQPSCIVMSAKEDERLYKWLQSTVSEILLSPSGFDASDVIKVMPSLNFSLDMCKRRILRVNLSTIPKHYLDSERSLYVSALVPFDNVCMVRAVGGLLKYLDAERVGIELEDSDVSVPLLGFKIFSLDNQMIIDQTALSALQIFKTESHPSVYKCGMGRGSKEGLSLFGILNRCKTKIGSMMLRQWFLRPLTDLDVLTQRHEAVGFFAKSQNVEVTTSLQGCVKNIKAVPRILAKMSISQASIADWHSLYKTVYNAIYIADLCQTQPQSISIFSQISKHFTADLQRISSLIGKVVDFDASALQDRFVVKAGVDTHLDEMKRTYNGLPDFMTKVAEKELSKLSQEVSQCSVIYLPQLGYLLAIPETENMKEDYAIPGLEFVFMSNKMVHYKNSGTRELDQLLGDSHCDIVDREIAIMFRLQDTVLEHSKRLMDVMLYAAELDCLLSLAECAREFSFTRPELSKDGILEIKAGRHPLQELCCSPFVPNDTQSGGMHSRIKVLTGPNASGKSVYIKQVGLIAFMAHIGSFVPAESARITMLDRIFTRIKSLESISVGLSTFMLDLNQMSDTLRNATKNSLAIIDEFGKGTQTVDGVSLLSASINHWLSMDKGCPHVFLCTHFHSLCQQKLIQPIPSPLISFQTMETVRNDDELVFLYQLIDGQTKSSYASYVAIQAGVPPEIISRGEEVSKLIGAGKPIFCIDSASSDMQIRRSALIVTKFLELDLQTADLYPFLQNFVNRTCQQEF